ncbi:LssY C-terminal domain-containing protein [Sinomonas sp. RB5]
MTANRQTLPESRTDSRTAHGPGRHLALAAVMAALMAAGVYAVRTLSLFISPMLFLAAVFLEVVFGAAFVLALVRALAAPTAVMRSLAASAWSGLRTNEHVVRALTSEAAPLPWLRDRFRLDRASGLWLTATAVIAAVPLVAFLKLAVTVATRGPLTQVDARIEHLMPSVRTPGETAVFTIATTLGSFPSILVMAVIAVAVLWWRRERLLAAAVVGTVAAQELLFTVAKDIGGRPRPDTALALVVETSPSFPSGHSVRATVVFGIIAYLVFKSLRSVWARTLTVSAYLLAVLAVTASRVYLGAHYVSDVWGGMLLGAALLAAVVGALEIAARFPLRRVRRRPGIPSRAIALAPTAALVFAAGLGPAFVHPQEHTAQATTQALPSLDPAAFSRLPLYSETLTGSRMEPASFVFVGSEEQVVRAFTRAGWQEADPSTLANTLRAFAVGFQGGQYASAPVTPAFMDAQPETLAFQKATAANSLRQRHHIRIWRTGFTAPDGRNVWEATASFDDGIEFAGPAKLPTHHIDPNVDAERGYIAGSLGLPGRLFQRTDPQMGHNASGDEFFTDGRADLVVLPAAAS